MIAQGVEKFNLLIAFGAFARQGRVHVRDIQGAIRVFENPFPEFNVVDVVIGRVLELVCGDAEEAEDGLVQCIRSTSLTRSGTG